METGKQEKEVSIRVWLRRGSFQWLLPHRHFVCRQQEIWQAADETIWTVLPERYNCCLTACYPDAGWPQSWWKGKRIGVSCRLRLFIEHWVLSSWLGRSFCFLKRRARRGSPKIAQQASQKANAAQRHHSIAWALLSESSQSTRGGFCCRSKLVRWTY